MPHFDYSLPPLRQILFCVIICTTQLVRVPGEDSKSWYIKQHLERNLLKRSAAKSQFGVAMWCQVQQYQNLMGEVEKLIMEKNSLSHAEPKAWRLVCECYQ